MVSDSEILHRFSYHAPKDNQPEKYQVLRGKALEFAKLILLTTPESRVQSLALTKLDEVVMWSNAAIARRE